MYEELAADRWADSSALSHINALMAELDAHDPINIQFHLAHNRTFQGCQPHRTAAPLANGTS